MLTVTVSLDASVMTVRSTHLAGVCQLKTSSSKYNNWIPRRRSRLSRRVAHRKISSRKPRDKPEKRKVMETRVRARGESERERCHHPDHNFVQQRQPPPRSDRGRKLLDVPKR